MSEFTLPKEVLLALARFDAIGKEAYIVGGCVRDMLRGITPNDWDITTACLPSETLSLFSDGKTIPTGIAHGTVTVLLDREALPLEITTFRVDGNYADHRRPSEVTFTASLVEDCARRDFTVNAMAYHPHRGLIDPFGGQADLAARTVRCVGDPVRRFTEDALRILRALRFSSVLDFDIEASTALAARTLAPTLSHISKERIRVELFKLLGGVRAAEILCAFPCVLAYALPSLSPLKNKALHIPLCEAFKRLADTHARLAACLYLCGVTAADAEWQLHTLTLSNKDTSTVCALLSTVDSPLPPDRIVMRRRLSSTASSLLEKQLSFAAAMHGVSPASALALLEETLQSGDATSLATLAVNGSELSTLGYRGAEIGHALHALLDAVIEERVPNEKAALFAYLQAERRNT